VNGLQKSCQTPHNYGVGRAAIRPDRARVQTAACASGYFPQADSNSRTLCFPRVNRLTIRPHGPSGFNDIKNPWPQLTDPRPKAPSRPGERVVVPAPRGVGGNPSNGIGPMPSGGRCETVELTFRESPV
jgi:hypothetical protein